MALDLAAWDLQAAKTPLADVAHRVFRNTVIDDTAGCIAALTLRRVEAKDPTALGEYADFVMKSSPQSEAPAVTSLFEPMIRHADEPEILRAAVTVFGPKSPWVPFVARGGPSSRDWYARSRLTELLGTELVRVSAFRAHVVASLADKQKVTEATVEKGSLVMRYANGSSSVGIDPSKGGIPADGTKLSLRVADYYADALTRLRHGRGAPPFELHWPVAERDRALTAMSAYVSSIR
jgi:hypothetical protein